MSDYGGADRGRRRKKRGGKRDYEAEGHPVRAVSPPQARPTFILAKPPAPSVNRSSISSDDPAAELSRPPSSVSPLSVVPPASGLALDKPVMLKTRNEARSATTSAGVQNIPSLLAAEGFPHSAVGPQQRSAAGVNDNTGQPRLVPASEMTHCIKLVDESFTWCDSGMEMLQDQTDFFTIGVIGMQGVGKSTILSMLAGSSACDSHRTYAFKPQSKEVSSMCTHQTVGIDIIVTPERMVLLDTQPVLSASILDHVIHHDKKFPAEFITAENCIEMQSLQIASFLMTVCNVVVVMIDWFADINIFRFLQTAEMLKPPTPPSTHDGEETKEYYPQVVFVLNKAEHEDFSTENYNLMTTMISTVLENSKLNYKGSVNVADGRLIPGLNPRTVHGDVNLYLLPYLDWENRTEAEGALSLIPDFRGHPSFEELMRGLRNRLFSLPRLYLTHAVLSEKNWFHYAARMWEAVKKSAFFSEYNRLLP